MNGCHSTIQPMNRKHMMVTSPQYKHTSWPYRFTRDCQYDNKAGDSGCKGCDQTKLTEEIK